MKKKKNIIIPVAVILAVAIIICGGYFLLMKSVPEVTFDGSGSNFKAKDKTYVIAESQDIGEAPAYTKYGIDYFLRDYRKIAGTGNITVRFTSDNVPVVISEELSKYSDAAELFGEDADVSTLTYEQLSEVNLAKNYIDNAGNTDYVNEITLKGMSKVTILDLENYLSYSEHKTGYSGKYIISFHDESEIKDVAAALQAINKAVTDSFADGRVIIKTNSKSIAEQIDESFPALCRFATSSEAKSFFISTLFNKKITEDKVAYDGFCVEPDEGLFAKFGTEKFINNAHNSGLAVIFENIGDDEIQKLSSAGADAIIINDFENAYNIIQNGDSQAQTETAANAS